MEFAEAHSNRGVALQELRQFDAAIKGFDRAIAINPEYVEAYSNRGNVLQELKHLDAAVASYDQAIALRPDYVEAHYNLGNALRELQQLEAAVASYDRAIAINPDYAEAHHNRGVSLHDLLKPEEALACFDRAISLKPDYAEAYWNKSFTLLLKGDLGEGFKLYESRWNNKKNKLKQRNFPRPLWLGVESLQGKTILLHSEQGLGDVIHFCRYAGMVASLGARVFLEVPKILMGLLNNLEGVTRIFAQGSPLSDFDYHCPLLSLPLAFKTNLETIPHSKAYLRSNDAKMAEWAKKLGIKTRPRIGIVWSGSTSHINDHNRSMLLSRFIPHLPEGFEYVSIQKEVRDRDLETLHAHPDIRHFGEELSDFEDTAALCELMDLIITVDTSVAHLCGALGKATWILLPYSPDWRWLLDRSDSPWYQTVRLFRQDAIGDWGSVLKRVKDALNSNYNNRVTSSITRAT